MKAVNSKSLRQKKNYEGNKKAKRKVTVRNNKRTEVSQNISAIKIIRIFKEECLR